MQKQKIVQKIDPDILQFLKGRKEVPVNTMIILINIVVFFLTELTGSSLDGKHLVQWGAAYTPLIQEGHEYYRFFTCMFLHFGLTHLGNNMLVLFFLGDCLERAVGTIPVHLHIRRNGSQSDFLSVRGANRRKRRVCRGIRCNFCHSGCIDLCSNQK